MSIRLSTKWSVYRSRSLPPIGHSSSQRTPCYIVTAVLLDFGSAIRGGAPTSHARRVGTYYNNII